MEVIIAGAGIIGASIAWRLAQRGARVKLLDSGRFASEASWAGAGMLAPGGEIAEGPLAGPALDSLRMYPDYVRELEEESGLPIDFQRKGAIELALDEQEWLLLRERAARQQNLGIASEPVDPGDMPLLGRPAAGALLFPGDALVDPRHVTAALAKA